ncbi:Uncharacterised protein r2_g1452 [Pycnogonum litorale]
MNLTCLTILCCILCIFNVVPLVESIVAGCVETSLYAASFLYSGMSSVSSIVSDHLTVILDAATYLCTMLSPFSCDVSSSEPVISDTAFTDTFLSSVISLDRGIVEGHLVAILIAGVCATVYAIVSIIDGHINKVPNTGDSNTQTPVRKHVCRLFDTDVGAARKRTGSPSRIQEPKKMWRY